jgi:hypothetical protein
VATVPAATTAPAPPAGPPPLAQIAGPPPAAANANQQTQSDRTSEILGAAIVALIVLGAIAYALSRRRRTRETVYEEEAYEPETTYVEPEPVRAAAPIAEEQPPIVAPETSAFAWGNRPDAGTLETPATARAAEEEQPSTLPNGFDLSRFGPHVQAAYRGPTEDNPSLSLRHRLRRAAAMDQKERAMGIRSGDAPMNGETVTERGELADAWSQPPPLTKGDAAAPQRAAVFALGEAAVTGVNPVTSKLTPRARPAVAGSSTKALLSLGCSS